MSMANSSKDSFDYLGLEITLAMTILLLAGNIIVTKWTYLAVISAATYTTLDIESISGTIGVVAFFSYFIKGSVVSSTVLKLSITH